MRGLLELLFGVKRDAAPGVERFIEYNPPHWMQGHAPLYNFLFVVAAVALVVLVYRRDGRRVGPRIGLGVLRALLLFWVIYLINRPILKEVSSHTEPSVLAILIDDSISMMIPDVNPDGSPSARPKVASTPIVAPDATGQGPSTQSFAARPATRLEAAVNLLTGEDQLLLRRLAKTHTLKFYRFDKDAVAVGTTAGLTADDKARAATQPSSGNAASDAVAQLPRIDPKLVESLRKLAPEGKSTQVVTSILTALDDLQGQRLAGVVLITDARETPTAAQQGLFERFKKYAVKVYPVPVGSDKAPLNIEMVSLGVQDSAFKDDLVSVKVQVRATGYDAGKAVHVRLRNKRTGEPLRGVDGSPVEKTMTIDDDRPAEEELIFKPRDLGLLDVEAVADPEPGELDDRDNSRSAQVAVLDAKINVLYVDGYPRWEYRYIKNEMIRDKTVNISCLLTSADPTFAQEGDPPDEKSGFPGPITRFPEKMEELMAYDVVLFGDVDPRQFTDAQLQMIAEFVDKKGGGFGMIAGPRFSPVSYRNSALEAVLPVNIANVLPEDSSADYREGFRPVITDEGRRGEASTIFRFFADKAVNEKYLRDDLQPIFWFCQGISPKPTGLVYAEHPFASDPNTGRKAPILVLGRFGSGRTLFSAIDDSWRWRYYTGESVFDTYWVQQLRYLARSKKLGQRRLRFNADKATYEQGQQVRLELKVIDPMLLPQLPPQMRVDIVDEKGVTVRQETLQRQESPSDLYAVTFPGDVLGKFTVKLPDAVTNSTNMDVPIEVIYPRLELSKPQVDELMLRRLAPPEQIVPLAEARKLPDIIKSAARTVPVPNTEPLWNRWQALAIFMLLLTTEWVLRKAYGMI